MAINVPTNEPLSSLKKELKFLGTVNLFMLYQHLLELVLL